MNQSTQQTDSEVRFKLPRVAFFGRTLAEYLQMFSLNLEELRGMKILDVASGPGSFVAEARALGLDVTGCDPLYAHDADSITAQGKADIDACREQIRKNPRALIYRDIDTFYREKYSALEQFATDFRRRGGDRRYVAGALPSLPFSDKAFDVVLSANFLMIYAPLPMAACTMAKTLAWSFTDRLFRNSLGWPSGRFGWPGCTRGHSHRSPIPTAGPSRGCSRKLGSS